MSTKSLTLSSVLSLSWREICNRFQYLFTLAAIGPLAAWLTTEIITGLNLSNSFIGLLLSLFSFLVSVWGLISLILFVCKREDSFSKIFLAAFKLMPRVVGGILFYVLLVSIYVVISIMLVGLVGLIIGFDGFGLGLSILLVLLLAAGLAAINVYCILFPYILILTDISVWLALPAAYTLVKNHFWKTIGLLLVLGLIGGGIYLISGVAFTVIAMAVSLIWPGLSSVFSFLFIIPTALVMLANQIPLIAVYVDRLPLLRTPQKQTSSEH